MDLTGLADKKIQEQIDAALLTTKMHFGNLGPGVEDIARYAARQAIKWTKRDLIAQLQMENI